MDGNPDFRDLLSAFEKGGIRYLIVGGYAVVHHTEPRYTKAIDIWVDTRPENARRVFAALSDYGAPLEGITVQDFMNRRVIFQIGLDPNRIDIIMGVKGLRFDAAWRRRVRGRYDDLSVNVLGMVDLIRNKRAVGRPVDQLDVEALEAARRRPRSRRATGGRGPRRKRGG